MTLQLLHGDCLELMKTLPDKSIDLFICDLPYGCLTGGAGKEKKKRQLTRYENGEPTDREAIYRGGVIAGCSWDIKIDLEQFWIQVKRLCKTDNTPVIHFCNTRFGAELIASNPSWFRYDLVWSKTLGVGFLSANKQPLRSHENIYVFSKKGAYYKRIDIEGDYKKSNGGCKGSNIYRKNETNTKMITDNTGKRCVKSVIEVANKRSKGQHPTAKPLDLYKWLISRYCVDGGTILDPTAGSFNSGLACKELGLNYIGIEKDDTFFARGKEKFE